MTLLNPAAFYFCLAAIVDVQRLDCWVRDVTRYFPLAIAAVFSNESLKNKHQCPDIFFCPTLISLRSSPRPISIGQLNAFLHLHSRPINLVVFKGSYSIFLMADLILGLASHLDAFSAYLIPA